MVHANLLGRMVRLLTSIPVVVCSAHSVNEGGWCRDWWYRLTDRLCDLTVHVSSVGLRRYTQRRMVNPKTAMFVPNAVDTTVFRSDPDSRQQVRRALALDPHFVWLAVGSLDKAKDYPNLIQAFAHVCRDDADSLLLIAGDGVLRAQVQAMIEELGIGNRVKLLGTRTDIPHLMNAADAYVMSSAWEGMPCVLLEASACELPAVATDVGDAGEIIREGTTGFLVPAGQPERLAEAMIRMAALPRARRREMGQAAREHVEGAYSLRHVVDTWESLFSSLLAKKCQR
jgi:glycosyltransferase involved in cell wall biosynthesis